MDQYYGMDHSYERTSVTADKNRCAVDRGWFNRNLYYWYFDLVGFSALLELIVMLYRSMTEGSNNLGRGVLGSQL